MARQRNRAQDIADAYPILNDTKPSLIDVPDDGARRKTRTAQRGYSNGVEDLKRPDDAGH